MIPLLDTHQHLLYRDRLGYAWADRHPPLAGRAFTLDDYQSLAEGAASRRRCSWRATPTTTSARPASPRPLRGSRAAASWA
ncbi:hypothetical protein ACFSZS_02820 [Seohaeicola zhoushanensis]